MNNAKTILQYQSVKQNNREMIPFFQGYYSNQQILYYYQSLFHQNYFYPICQEIPLKSEMTPIIEKQATTHQSDLDACKQQQIPLVSQSRTEQVKNGSSISLNKALKLEAERQARTKLSKPSFSRVRDDKLKDIRNANSNLLRMFFRRLDQQMQQDPEFILGIIKRHRMRLTISKLTEWLQINKIQAKNYIRLASVKRLFFGPRKNQQTNKIMRILLGDFIKNEALSYYLTSKKLKRQSMGNNLNILRNIFSVLRDYSTQE